MENNQAHIAEYKEKNDTLTGLVAKYQAYAEENKQLKIDFSNEKAALVEQANAAEAKGNALQQELAESRN